MVIDSLYGLVLHNHTISFAAATEETLRGIVEFEGSSLRAIYTEKIKGTPVNGTHEVTGTLTVERLGWTGSPVALAVMLPPFVILVGMAIACLYHGLRTKHWNISPSIDPMSSTWLIAASATGGAAGGLQQLLDKGIENHRNEDFLKLKVKFDQDSGLSHIAPVLNAELDESAWREGGKEGYMAVEASDISQRSLEPAEC